MAHQMIPLLALRPTTQLDHERYRELRKLEHVCKTELRGDVNTATTLIVSKGAMDSRQRRTLYRCEYSCSNSQTCSLPDVPY
jgi:hypothetical protein